MSPEDILRRSYGEILKPETINYRSYKPEKEGLFCEKIFGPVKDYECHCGKYKGIRYRGIICDRCGVEVTRKKVRRERMGHITLAVPVVHIWFLRSVPGKLNHLMGISTRDLEKVIYYESYIVINPGASDKKKMELLDETEFRELDKHYGKFAVSEEDQDEENYFYAAMGGIAVRDALKALDISGTMKELEETIKTSRSKQRKADALKRLKVVKAFYPSPLKARLNKPEWMVITVLPVIPPELRPLVPLEGGRFAASDLNDLYRRVIIRNNRLKQLMDIKAPDVILRNEKRMLQEAVDTLFDNSRRGTAVSSGTRRPLKSLSDMLRGKQGRFRQNLLGKRVDYSGRSVIVVGPELKLHECGLPKDMATELFMPHIIHELIARGFANTPRSAKLMVQEKAPDVYEVLEYVVRDHPVLLNRAPTLHRLGIQAFQPVLVDGKAIQIHPLVCSAFNADFDGDQMAVHVPLSVESQMEARMLMLASHNILHPAHGYPLAIPSQDMVLGSYYLTKHKDGDLGEGRRFSSLNEVLMAYENNTVGLHAIIDVRHQGKWQEKTTVGRAIFNSVVPDELNYIDELLTKKKIEQIIYDCYLTVSSHRTVEFLDDLKNLGFKFATQSGVSIAIDDVLIPEEKESIISKADNTVNSIQSKFSRQILTEGERYNKVIDVWTHATNETSDSLMRHLGEDKQGFNPVFIMADSGARGSRDQIKQLAGMRGLMAKPKKSMTGSKGEIIENPITSNFREGLSVLEYFISTHGARKGLADTALKTADAGYLTRRLVDVAQDVVIMEEDCGTINGVWVNDLKEGEEVIEPINERIRGRIVQEDVYVDGEIVLKSGTLVDNAVADGFKDYDVDRVFIRSVLTCESLRGVCKKCYGTDLNTNKLAAMGSSVGIVAAQSIGEPGTQLTLRTFHIGGTASRIIEESEMKSRRDGKVEFSDNLEYAKVVDAEEGLGKPIRRVLVRNSSIKVMDDKGGISVYKCPYGCALEVENGKKIKTGKVLFTWDPYTDVILARHSGIVNFVDMVEGETYHEEAVEGGKKQLVTIEAKNRRLAPHLDILDKDGNTVAGGTILPIKAVLMVKNGQKVKAGEVLVKIAKDIGKTRDITGGLPRVAELFEARKPSEPAVVTEIDGVVKFGGLKRGIREIIVEGAHDVSKKYKMPYGRHVIVHENDRVSAGDRLCEGAISPEDILNILGPDRVQEYLVNEIQEVYRLQGVRINDKHIEVIVRQMMQKVELDDAGDTIFLAADRVNQAELNHENERILKSGVITDPGDSSYLEGDLITKSEQLEVNKQLKEKDKDTIKTRRANPATSRPLLLGITRASLNTESFISAASFQETTRVLTDASTEGKTDRLLGLKENVILGRLIPAGTGFKNAMDPLVRKVGVEEEIMESAKDDEKVVEEVKT
ncbi:MAG: DNA-directed RNA polymerase subunit beta' [Candidatus Marinimicrobia bacterium]|nr:DNA-directed RNA polymerase subunit beta' [Candidatus Neomarinimicrobiota bacterium]